MTTSNPFSPEYDPGLGEGKRMKFSVAWNIACEPWKASLAKLLAADKALRASERCNNRDDLVHAAIREIQIEFDKRSRIGSEDISAMVR